MYSSAALFPSLEDFDLELDAALDLLPAGFRFLRARPINRICKAVAQGLVHNEKSFSWATGLLVVGHIAANNGTC